MLSAIPDPLTPDTLRAALGARPFRFCQRVASTQDLAREWALNEPDLPGGAVVIAEQQTAGRGRQGRAWFSPPGASLLFSLVLRPRAAAPHLPRLTIAAGIAAAQALDPLLPGAVRLKWPNDVLMRGRKLGGILAEASWLGDRLQAVILGIGLNVRVDFGGMALAEYATSLEPETGRLVDRRTLLADLLARLDFWLGQADSPDLIAAWRPWLGTLGRRVTVYPQIDGGAAFGGVAEDVDADGALLVRDGSGALRRVLAADVGLAEAK